MVPSLPEEKKKPQSEFAGRSVLYVSEVAKRLEVTEQHILNLIEEGKLQAIDIGGGSRHFWRIPVPALETFMRERSNLADVISRQRPRQPG